MHCTKAYFILANCFYLRPDIFYLAPVGCRLQASPCGLLACCNALAACWFHLSHISPCCLSPCRLSHYLSLLSPCCLSPCRLSHYLSLLSPCQLPLIAFLFAACGLAAFLLAITVCWLQFPLAACRTVTLSLACFHCRLPTSFASHCIPVCSHVACRLLTCCIAFATYSLLVAALLRTALLPLALPLPALPLAAAATSCWLALLPFATLLHCCLTPPAVLLLDLSAFSLAINHLAACLLPLAVKTNCRLAACLLPLLPVGVFLFAALPLSTLPLGSGHITASHGCRQVI